MSPAGGDAPPGAALVARVRSRLEAAGIASAEAEAWALLEAVSGRSRLALLTESLQLDEAQRGLLDAWIRRRAAGEPLQHLLGRAPFWTFEVSSGPGRLVPRPETEGLVVWALERLRDREAPVLLDVGTGSGAVALALALERPDAEVWASDVAEPALAAARADAQRLGARVHFVHGDLLRPPALRALLPRLDLLLSNPPYLPAADRDAAAPEVRFDPPEALYAGAEGLDVWRRLEMQAHAGLMKGAEALVELDPRNVARAAREARGRWREVEVRPDLAGRARFLRLRR